MLLLRGFPKPEGWKKGKLSELISQPFHEVPITYYYSDISPMFHRLIDVGIKVSRYRGDIRQRLVCFDGWETATGELRRISQDLQ